MSQQPSKSIEKIFGFPIPLNGLTVTSGNSSINVTSAIGTALATGGINGTSLLNQVSSLTGLPIPLEQYTQGIDVISSAIMNMPVLSAGSFSVLVDPVSGSEIYAKLTTAAGVHTLTFYLASTNAVHTFASNTNLDTFFFYNAQWSLIPPDAFYRLKRIIVSDDPVSNGGKEITHWFGASGLGAIATLNTIPATFAGNVLEKIPIAGSVRIIYRGWIGTTSAGDITVVGQNVTWNPLTAGFPLNVGDEVEIVYRTLQP